jgi:formate hydrogenlyase transcriptional activator
MESQVASRLLKPAIDASPIAVLVADPSGNIVLVNRELERQFGSAREELLGRPLDLLMPEALRALQDDPADVAADAADADADDTEREVYGLRKDRSQLPVRMRLYRIPRNEGSFVLAAVVARTEHRVLDETLRAALTEQLDFERLVAELSLQFINIPADRTNDAISDGLGRICALLGVDRCSFYRIDANGLAVDPVSWTAADITAVDQTLPGREYFPWSFERLLAHDVIAFSTATEIPSEVDRSSYQSSGTRSAVILPLSVEGTVVAAIEFDAARAERTWPPEVMHRLKVAGSLFEQILARWQHDEAVRAASREAQRVREQLQVENIYLRREERERLGSTRIVGQSPVIARVLEQVQQVAATDATVLLLGETGTGKELFASYIHELSSRHAHPMIRVNCAAIPATLIESELFGRERGAFTGSLARQVGRFELADHSTIFLDEIGDLPEDVQLKLLRVLEEKTIERLGSPRPIAVDVRIIAATHRNLEERIRLGTFRQDLYYRLNVFPIQVPPLRERVQDIPLLLWLFVDEFSKAFGKRIDSIDKDSMEALQRYPWPGNIRELRNLVERATIVTTSRRLIIPLPPTPLMATRRSPKLVDVEKEHIRAVLDSTGWRIRGAGGAADRLGLKPTTLETRMAMLGLRRPGRE